MEGGRRRRWLARITEGAVSVVLVLAAFLTVLFLLGLSFPEGTGLRTLMTGEGLGPSDHTQGRRFEFADQFREPAEGIGIIASLSHTFRKVKDKPAGSIVWSDSVQGTRLRDRHAIQTYGRSGAGVHFDEGSSLSIGENSLVVLRKLRPERGVSGRRASMVVLEGELRVNVAGKEATPTEIEVATPGGAAIVRSSGTRGREADLRVRVNEDDSSTIVLFEGVAEIVSGNRKVLLQPNQALRLDADGSIGAPVVLPARPAAVGGEAGRRFTYRDVPPRVRLAWTTEGRPTMHRLAIARDPEFNDLLLNEKVEGTEFVHGNLPAGRYYWRVRAVDDWIEGPDSEPRWVELTRDTSPPTLRVVLPEGPVATDHWMLVGEAEPGARVWVGDEETGLGRDGSFHKRIELQRGINLVVVEAMDAAGNTTYRSSFVTANF